MTLTEFIWYRQGVMDRMKRDWDRTASVMALFANANAPKGKTYSVDDFHPFEALKRNQGQVSSQAEADALLEKMRKF